MKENFDTVTNTEERLLVSSRDFSGNNIGNIKNNRRIHDILEMEMKRANLVKKSFDEMDSYQKMFSISEQNQHLKNFLSRIKTIELHKNNNDKSPRTSNNNFLDPQVHSKNILKDSKDLRRKSIREPRRNSIRIPQQNLLMFDKMTNCNNLNVPNTKNQNDISCEIKSRSNKRKNSCKNPKNTTQNNLDDPMNNMDDLSSTILFIGNELLDHERKKISKRIPSGKSLNNIHKLNNMDKSLDTREEKPSDEDDKNLSNRNFVKNSNRTFRLKINSDHNNNTYFTRKSNKNIIRTKGNKINEVENEIENKKPQKIVLNKTLIMKKLNNQMFSNFEHDLEIAKNKFNVINVINCEQEEDPNHANRYFLKTQSSKIKAKTDLKLPMVNTSLMNIEAFKKEKNLKSSEELKNKESILNTRKNSVKTMAMIKKKSLKTLSGNIKKFPNLINEEINETNKNIQLDISIKKALSNIDDKNQKNDQNGNTDLNSNQSIKIMKINTNNNSNNNNHQINILVNQNNFDTENKLLEANFSEDIVTKSETQMRNLESSNGKRVSGNREQNLFPNKENSIISSHKDSFSEKSDKEEAPQKLKQEFDNGNFIKINQVYDSLSEDENIIRIKENNIYLHPHSPAKFIIDFLNFCVGLYSITLLPLQIIFHNEVNLFNLFVEIIVSLILICDFISSFFLAYYDFEENFMNSINKTIINYIRTYFLIDFIATIPFGLIQDTKKYLTNLNDDLNNINEYHNIKLFLSQSDHMYFSQCYTYLSLINYGQLDKILKILRIFKVFKIFSHNSFFNKIKDIFTQGSIVANLDEKMFFYYIGFFVISHILTCLFIFLGTVDYPNWIIKASLIDESFLSLYLNSLYFNHTTIFTVGYGDILTKNSYERMYNNILMIIGIMLYSLALTSISNIVKMKDEKNKEYENKKELLNNLSENYFINSELYDKLQRHLFHEMQHGKNKIIDFLNELPITAKTELVLNMHREIIAKFNFFKGCFDNDFIIQVIMVLKPTKSVKNDILLKQGDFLEEIIFVKNGIVQLESIFNITSEPKVGRTSTNMIDLNKIIGSNTNGISQTKTYGIMDDNSFNQMGTCKNFENPNPINHPIKFKILQIRRNEHFGDALMIENIRSPITLLTKSKIAELYLMNKIDVMKVSELFPSLFEKIYMKSAYNFSQILKRIETIKSSEEDKFKMANSNFKKMEGSIIKSNNYDLSKSEDKSTDIFNYKKISEFEKVPDNISSGNFFSRNELFTLHNRQRESINLLYNDTIKECEEIENRYQSENSVIKKRKSRKFKEILLRSPVISLKSNKTFNKYLKLQTISSLTFNKNKTDNIRQYNNPLKNKQDFIGVETSKTESYNSDNSFSSFSDSLRITNNIRKKNFINIKSTNNSSFEIPNESNNEYNYLVPDEKTNFSFEEIKNVKISKNFPLKVISNSKKYSDKDNFLYQFKSSNKKILSKRIEKNQEDNINSPIINNNMLGFKADKNLYVSSKKKSLIKKLQECNNSKASLYDVDKNKNKSKKINLTFININNYNADNNFNLDLSKLSNIQNYYNLNQKYNSIINHNIRSQTTIKNNQASVTNDNNPNNTRSSNILLSLNQNDKEIIFNENDNNYNNNISKLNSKFSEVDSNHNYNTNSDKDFICNNCYKQIKCQKKCPKKSLEDQQKIHNSTTNTSTTEEKSIQTESALEEINEKQAITLQINDKLVSNKFFNLQIESLNNFELYSSNAFLSFKSPQKNNNSFCSKNDSQIQPERNANPKRLQLRAKTSEKFGNLIFNKTKTISSFSNFINTGGQNNENVQIPNNLKQNIKPVNLENKIDPQGFKMNNFSPAKRPSCVLFPINNMLINSEANKNNNNNIRPNFLKKLSITNPENLLGNLMKHNNFMRKSISKQRISFKLENNNNNNINNNKVDNNTFSENQSGSFTDSEFYAEKSNKTNSSSSTNKMGMKIRNNYQGNNKNKNILNNNKLSVFSPNKLSDKKASTPNPTKNNLQNKWRHHSSVNSNTYVFPNPMKSNKNMKTTKNLNNSILSLNMNNSDGAKFNLSPEKNASSKFCISKNFFENNKININKDSNTNNHTPGTKKRREKYKKSSLEYLNNKLENIMNMLKK